MLREITARYYPTLMTAALVALLPPLGYGDDLAKEFQGAVSAMKQDAGIAGLTDGLQAPPAVGTERSSSDVVATPLQKTSAAVDILSHVTLTEGVEFPKEDEIIWEPTPTAPPIPEVDKAQQQQERTYRKPGRCEKDGTRRAIWNAGASETRALYDYLYLPEDLVPVDPQEVFGADVKLEPVGPKSGEAVEILMEINGVPCLPYRRRITDLASYEDFGVNALRNYSKDQAGKGTLDIRMQHKLFPKTKR